MKPLLTINLSSPTPIGEQIAHGIRAAIAAGDLPPGTALPTVRQLAGDLGVNLNTVARAYRALETTGLVQTRRGRGTEVVANRARPIGTEAQRDHELELRMQQVLVDMRLAGMGVTAARQLAKEQIDSLWTKEQRK